MYLSREAACSGSRRTSLDEPKQQTRALPRTTTSRHANQAGLLLRLEVGSSVVAVGSRNRKKNRRRGKIPYSFVTRAYLIRTSSGQCGPHACFRFFFCATCTGWGTRYRRYWGTESDTRARQRYSRQHTRCFIQRQY